MPSVLAFDPGAERCGWADLEDGPTYVTSGVLGLSRLGLEFQVYRVSLEAYVYEEIEWLINHFKPDLIVNEIVPPIGGGNFVGPQSYLTNIVATVIHICALRHGVEVKQVAARSVQSKIAVRGRSKKITKVQVRNGVIAVFPALKDEIMRMKPDETDAIAIGLSVML